MSDILNRDPEDINPNLPEEVDDDQAEEDAQTLRDIERTNAEANQ